MEDIYSNISNQVSFSILMKRENFASQRFIIKMYNLIYLFFFYITSLKIRYFDKK